MAIRVIPTSTRHSNYSQRTVLDGVQYELRFHWNGREHRWYFSVYDSEGQFLAAQRKIVSNAPLLSRDTNPLLPPGMLYALDTESNGVDPGLSDLGSRVKLMYIDEDSLV